MTRRTIWIWTNLVVAVVVGCAKRPDPPPKNALEHEQTRQDYPPSYPNRTVLLYNAQRVLDPTLDAEARAASLELIDRLEAKDLEVDTLLAQGLSAPNSPDEIRRPLMRYLLRRGHPGMAAYVVTMLPTLDRSSPLRAEVLAWLASHPGPATLSQIVKLWAQESSTTGANEPRFRHMVEQISGTTWQEALLNGINSRAFDARGSAIEVLSTRVPATMLRMQVARMKPETEPMLVLQKFLDLFNYMPTNRGEFIQAATIYNQRSGMLDDAMAAARSWRRDYGYQFNIRDFHLISRIACDPLRANLRRTQLLMEAGKAIKARSHVAHKPARPGGKDDYLDNFWLQVDSFSLPDLWNLYLLNEMLSRPRVQVAMKLMADGDRHDTAGAWGGLVFYQNGQAEAILYPPDEGSSDDTRYHPPRLCIVHGRDSLCRFHAHFEKVDNASRAGPNAEELADARQQNYYGLVLTRLSDNSFCAHYYNPQGVVVSLGIFALRDN